MLKEEAFQEWYFEGCPAMPGAAQFIFESGWDMAMKWALECQSVGSLSEESI